MKGTIVWGYVTLWFIAVSQFLNPDSAFHVVDSHISSVTVCHHSQVSVFEFWYLYSWEEFIFYKEGKMWLILHCRDCGDQQDILAEHLSTQRGSWFDQGDIGISIKGSAWCPCQTALHLHCGCVSATITVDILWQEGAFSTRNLKQAQWKANLEGDNGGEKLHVASFLIQLSH